MLWNGLTRARKPVDLGLPGRTSWSAFGRQSPWHGVLTGMDDFKIGDLVRLKSGGPLMTVNGVSAYGSITCFWFSRTTYKVRSCTFNAKALERSERRPPGRPQGPPQERLDDDLSI